MDNLAAMKIEFAKFQKNIILTEKVNEEERGKYGIVESKDIKLNSVKLNKISKILEKPKKGLTDSNTAVCGRYIFTPTIFNFIKKSKK